MTDAFHKYAMIADPKLTVYTTYVCIWRFCVNSWCPVVVVLCGSRHGPLSTFDTIEKVVIVSACERNCPYEFRLEQL